VLTTLATLLTSAAATVRVLLLLARRVLSALALVALALVALALVALALIALAALLAALVRLILIYDRLLEIFLPGIWPTVRQPVRGSIDAESLRVATDAPPGLAMGTFSCYGRICMRFLAVGPGGDFRRRQRAGEH
jgi:hypothetical protein